MLFGRQAEIAGEYLKKGRSVYIEGRLQTRKYTDKEGVEKYSTEIVGDRMQLLGGREGGGGGGGRRRVQRRRLGVAPGAAAAAAASPAAAHRRRRTPTISTTTSRSSRRRSAAQWRCPGSRNVRRLIDGSVVALPRRSR